MTPAADGESRDAEQFRSIIRDALAVRDQWSAFFNDIVSRPDLDDPALHPQILRTASECRARLTDYRAQLREVRVLAGTAALAGRVDASMWRYILICEAAGKITSPVTRDALARIGDLMREASGSLGFDGVAGEVSLFRPEAERAAESEEAPSTSVIEAHAPMEAAPAVAPEVPTEPALAEAPQPDPPAEPEPVVASAPAAAPEAPAPARPDARPSRRTDASASAGASAQTRPLVRRRAAQGGLVAAAALAVAAAGLAWTLSRTPPPGPPTPTPLSFVTTARETNDLRLRVLDEVRARGLDFADVDVRLLPPNRVGIQGTVKGPEGPEQIELQFVIAVGADGAVTATAVDMVALNPDLKPPPPQLEAALAEVTRGLAPVPPQGQVLRRVVIFNDALSGEFQTAPP